MSRRLDLPLAALAWLAGFAWVRWKGSWAPLAVLALLAAARLLASDPETRRLLLPRRTTAALAASGALAMIGATYGLYALLSAHLPWLPLATADLYGVLHAGGYAPAPLALLVVVIAACEEVVWRGRPLLVAERAARPRLLGVEAAGRVLALSLLYGACHASSGSLLLALLAAACGTFWGFLRVAGRSLWPSILVHAAWDLTVLVLWPLA